MTATGTISSLGAIAELFRMLFDRFFYWKSTYIRKKQIEENRQEYEQIDEEINNNELDDLNTRWGWDSDN